MTVGAVSPERRGLATMKATLATVLGILLAPPVALCQTHCRKDEIDYLSCPTTSGGKILSVCGNIVGGNVADDSWVQYRFGRVGHVELTYPAGRAGSTKKFEGVYFSRYHVVSLRFIQGRALYDVGLAQGYRDGVTQEQVKSSGGVGVILGKTRHLNISCTTVDIPKYFSLFSELAPSLGPYNDKEDILQYFYNEVAR